MSNIASFHPIDQQTWPIAQSFYYYSVMAPTSYTVTVALDVTAMRSALKEAGYKFFPAYLYLVTSTLAEQPDLCVAKQEETVGYWDHLTPIYPLFHEDTKTTSLLWTEYAPVFSQFHERYLQDKEQHGNQHGILTSKGVPPPNAYVISCIPWFSFQSFSLHNHGIKDYYFPSLEAGGFVTEAGGRITMPLSVTVHHATTEGYHLKVFFESLQDRMSHPAQWI